MRILFKSTDILLFILGIISSIIWSTNFIKSYNKSVKKPANKIFSLQFFLFLIIILSMNIIESRLLRDIFMFIVTLLIGMPSLFFDFKAYLKDKQFRKLLFFIIEATAIFFILLFIIT